jgi:hypothetical protein
MGKICLAAYRVEADVKKAPVACKEVVFSLLKP